MLDVGIPVPKSGRTFAARRRVRLADVDPHGRVRFDAFARLLQDVAIDDVQETGWGTPQHLWFVRRMRIRVHRPFVADTQIELVTWCSGVAAIAAGRRWSVAGDRSGRAEVDSVWIHLDPDQRPTRIEGFGLYADAAAGRHVSTRLELPDPSEAATASPWPLRSSDFDMHGHVNNAVHWQAVEDALVSAGVDAAQPLAADLDYREPLDAGDRVELATERRADGLLVALRTPASVRAVAAIVLD